MPLILKSYSLGPIQNNSFLLLDDERKIAAVVDPPFGSSTIQDFILSEKLHLKMILLTHAHFDHIGGINLILPFPLDDLKVFLHPDDLQLWESGGGASQFGFSMDIPMIKPSPVEHMDILSLGDSQIRVLHTPGHTPGHVTYYLPEEKTAFCGDLIFYHGVGRTDLPGASGRTLIQSIKNQILTLPEDTVLIPGHGPFTSVAEEKTNNPFLV